MTGAAIFVFIGFMCGMLLRATAFMIATCLILAAYVIAFPDPQIAASTIVDVVVGLIALQVGYFAAVALRIAYAAARGASNKSAKAKTKRRKL
jgi:membrane protein implicated in regulation of membrane protease activity